MGLSASSSSLRARLRVWDLLSALSALWLKIGIWPFCLLLWLLGHLAPGSATAKVIGLLIGVVTGVALLYLVHYLLFAWCSRGIRRVCLPFLALIDILAIGGVAALLLRAE
jgi:hypothetical protein